MISWEAASSSVCCFFCFFLVFLFKISPLTCFSMTPYNFFTVCLEQQSDSRHRKFEFLFWIISDSHIIYNRISSMSIIYCIVWIRAYLTCPNSWQKTLTSHLYISSSTDSPHKEIHLGSVVWITQQTYLQANSHW